MTGHNNAFSTSHRPKCTGKGPDLIRTWFNQPARRHRRRVARADKAEKCFPRPMDKLRPIVTCCSYKYNMSKRAGKGFTPIELTTAGVSITTAYQLGIAVDKRRVNKSQESIDRNVARLQEYMGKVVVFGKGTPKEEIQKAIQHSGPVMPIQRNDHSIVTASIADQEVLPEVFKTLRHERTEWKRVRMELIKAREEAAKNK